MHYKAKEKLKLVHKLYLVEPEEDKTIQLKIQLKTREYAQIDLNLPLPNKLNYHSLSHGGFNYDPQIDISITHYSAKQVKKILLNSIGYRNNNTDTIEKLIEIIDTMPEHI